jgi:hypothetical protein
MTLFFAVYWILNGKNAIAKTMSGDTITGDDHGNPPGGGPQA